VIAEFAAAILLEGVDDDRASTHLAAARAGFKKMVSEARGLQSAGSRQFGKIIPREDDFVEGDGRYVRTEDGFIIDLGG